MKILEPYVYLINSDDMIAMLKNVTFSAAKLELLEVIAEYLADINEESKKKIVEKAFDFSGDKKKAEEILNRVKPRNVIYG